MGTNISRAQLSEYKEIAKDRMSEEAIAYLYMKFSAVAPDGHMTPLQFGKYMHDTGVYKNQRVAARQRQIAVDEEQQRMNHGNGAAWAPSSWFGSSTNKAADLNAIAIDDDRDSNAAVTNNGELYLHLFRGYDLDGDGIITFKEFLIYHLAIIYSTEELFFVIFNTYDEDQDGYLSLGDLKTVITASTRYVGDYDVRDREVQRVIDEEARRLMGFLDIRKQGRVQRDDMRLIVQKYPQVLEKMKNLM